MSVFVPWCAGGRRQNPSRAGALAAANSTTALNRGATHRSCCVHFKRIVLPPYIR